MIQTLQPPRPSSLATSENVLGSRDGGRKLEFMGWKDNSRNQRGWNGQEVDRD